MSDETHGPFVLRRFLDRGCVCGGIHAQEGAMLTVLWECGRCGASGEDGLLLGLDQSAMDQGFSMGELARCNACRATKQIHWSVVAVYHSEDEAGC